MEATKSKKHVYFNQKIPKSVNRNALSADGMRLIGYMTYRMGQSQNFKSHGWLPVPSDTLRSLLGGGYLKVMNEVQAKGIVLQYSNKDGVSYSKDKGICKQFKFAPLYAADVKADRLDVTPSRQARVYFDGKPKKEIRESAAPCIEKLIRAYDGITVCDAWQDAEWERDGDTEQLREFWGNWTWATQIGSGRVTAKESGSGRLYHPLICMKRELRPFARYRGRTIHYIDVKAAHPFFLALFADCGEQERWLTLCRADIYKGFESATVSRDDVKTAFQVAISPPSYHGRGKLAESILELIQREAPSIHRWLLSQWEREESVQFVLQSLESEIFVKRGFMELPFWNIPMHDGLAVEAGNLDAAYNHLGAVAKEILGFELILEKL